MGRSALYAIIAILIIIIIAGGSYWYLQEHQKPSLEIQVDQDGLSIEGNS